jgi:hypothetical protein
MPYYPKPRPEYRFAKAISISLVTALGAYGLTGCGSPKKEYCYIGTVGSKHDIKPGLRADLVDEIESNFALDENKVDLSNVRGATAAGIEINAVLAALHVKDGDGTVPAGSIDNGDKYPYCISSDGLITPGTHGYEITNPR